MTAPSCIHAFYFRTIHTPGRVHNSIAGVASFVRESHEVIWFLNKRWVVSGSVGQEALIVARCPWIAAWVYGNIFSEDPLLGFKGRVRPSMSCRISSARSVDVVM